MAAVKLQGLYLHTYLKQGENQIEYIKSLTFQPLDNRHFRNTIPDRKEAKEVIPVILQAYYLEMLIRLQGSVGRANGAHQPYGDEATETEIPGSWGKRICAGRDGAALNKNS